MKKQCIKVYSDVQPQNDLEYVSPQIYFPYFQEDINGLDKIEEYEPSDIDRARMTHWEYNFIKLLALVPKELKDVPESQTSLLSMIMKRS